MLRCAVQVVVDVARGIHDCRGVGRGLVVDNQSVVRRQRVGDRDVEVARIALFAVGGAVGHGDGGISFGRRGLAGVPDAAFESSGTAVQVVLAVVDRQLVLLAVEREASFADAVAEASHDGSAVFVGRAEIGVDAVVSPYHVAEAAVGGRNPERDDACAVIGELHGHAVGVLQGVESDGFPVDFGSEGGGIEQFDAVSAVAIACAGEHAGRGCH